MRKSSASSGRQQWTSGEFDPIYVDLISHIGKKPALHLGLLGLCLLHALVRAGAIDEAKSYLESIEQKIHSVESKAINSRRRLKHETIFIPLARAVYLSSADPSAEGLKKAFISAASIMRAYHAMTRRHARRRGEQVNDDVAKSLKIASPASSNSFPVVFHGRHVLEMIGGSGEQRSVITDWWIELLFANNEFAEVRNEAASIVQERQGRGCSHFYALIAQCEERMRANDSRS